MNEELSEERGKNVISSKQGEQVKRISKADFFPSEGVTTVTGSAVRLQ